jgi:phosphoribosylformylglycinamidine (FGAM) synthase-like enzyme
MIKRAEGGEVPDVEPAKARETMDSLTRAIDKGLVRACHDCSEGGIAVAAAEMCIAGELGMRIDLRKVPQDGVGKNYKILFSESNSRFLVEIEKAKEREFEKAMGKHASKIGEVTAAKFIVTGLEGREMLNEKIDGLKKAWKGTFDW